MMSEMEALPSGARRVTFGAGLSMLVPEAWETFVAPDPRIALLARESSDSPSVFRMSHVVETGSEAAGTELRDWQMAVETAQEQELYRYLLLNLEHSTIDGNPSVTRFAAYRLDSGQPVTIRQDSMIRGDGSWFALTSSVATMDFPVYEDYLQRCAASVRLEPGDRL